MDNSRFSIFQAAKSAYIFMGRNWLYLLRAGLVPIGLQIVAALYTQFGRPDASQIEGYLWGLPATMLFSWFMFLETRLLLLGENLHSLPKDRAYLADRLHAMKVSVLCSLLFNMGTAGALSLLLALEESGQWGTSWPVTLCGFFILCSIFWGIRFGIIPILTAVHHPIRPVLLQTRSMMFSLRLIGMSILCVLPIAFLFQIIIALVIPESADQGVAIKLTEQQQVAIITLSAPLSLFAAALLNAAAAYALKQILGSRRGGVVI